MDNGGLHFPDKCNINIIVHGNFIIKNGQERQTQTQTQTQTQIQAQGNQQLQARKQFSKRNVPKTGASKSTATKGNHKKPLLYKGRLRMAIVKALYDLGAFDKAHAAAKEDIIGIGIKHTKDNLCDNPKSSSPDFSKKGLNAIGELKDNNFIGKNDNGYFLTKEGIEEFRAKMKKMGEDPGNDQSGSVVDCSGNRQQDEYMDEENTSADNDGDDEGMDEEGGNEEPDDERGTEEEEEEHHERGLMGVNPYVIALFFLEQENNGPFVWGFTKQEILAGFHNLIERFPGVRFDTNERVLEQGIRDGLIERREGEYKLTGMGEGVAFDAFSRLF